MSTAWNLHFPGDVSFAVIRPDFVGASYDEGLSVCGSGPRSPDLQIRSRSTMKWNLYSHFVSGLEFGRIFQRDKFEFVPYRIAVVQETIKTLLFCAVKVLGIR
jgi:hypothetical protein